MLHSSLYCWSKIVFSYALLFSSKQEFIIRFHSQTQEFNLRESYHRNEETLTPLENERDWEKKRDER